MSKSIANRKVTTIKQAIDSFLLSCKVEGKSYGTIECYTDKLKGFLWRLILHGCIYLYTKWYNVFGIMTTQKIRGAAGRINNLYPRLALISPWSVVQIHSLPLRGLIEWPGPLRCFDLQKQIQKHVPAGTRGLCLLLRLFPYLANITPVIFKPATQIWRKQRVQNDK
jgi:hypothetical protein